MKKLTEKEYGIMSILWSDGPISMRELVENMEEPRPHFNTVATLVHRLEEHHMVSHQAIGAKFYLYEAAVTKEQYANFVNKKELKQLFDGSYIDFISQLVKEEEVSIEELKELIRMVEE